MASRLDSQLIPTRFLLTMAHFIAILMVFYTKVGERSATQCSAVQSLATGAVRLVAGLYVRLDASRGLTPLASFGFVALIYSLPSP